MSICQRVSLPSLCAATFHRNSLSVILHRFPSTSFSSSRTMSSLSSVSPSQHITSGENTTSNPPPPAQNIISSSSSTPMYLSSHRSRRFALSPDFVKKYATKKPPFGYNGLGELVYRRTYSRKKEDGTNEQWFETVERVVNGTYNMQKRWIEEHELGWNPWKAQKSAQEMYARIFDMKFLPPGRGLWAMGSPVTEQRRLFAALNNCAYVSTEHIDKDEPTKPFTFLMDASMLGVGVGFDTKGAGKISIKGPRTDKPTEKFVIPDSREGWVEGLHLLLTSYFDGKSPVEFSYEAIRPYGTPIKGFGGVASGPGALEELLESVRKLLDKRVGQPISVTDIVDIMNYIGRCVVAGNVRRTAEIAFGDPNSTEYLDLKNYAVNPQRAAFGWTSNNSIFAELGMDYNSVCERVRLNGEPGFAWLDNMQNYARMNGVVDNRDHRVRGANPCSEQSLESFELCCLVEALPNNHENLEDFLRTLKFAYLYAKTVTLGKTHWPETNRVMLRNRRIGCSVTGLAQFISKHGLHTLQQWLEKGYQNIQYYDKEYSDWLAIPRSIKTTSIKPSGTVSLLAGATPGMHYPESRFYIRRVRLSGNSELLAPLKEAGYHIEPAETDPATMVVEIPVDVGEGVRTISEVSMWEQLSLAAFLQRHWADNQVSCTVTFDPATEGPQLPHALNYFQYQLKGISFLPKLEFGAYKQMPYEKISEEEYKKRVAVIQPLSLNSASVSFTDATPDRFCDGDTCSVAPPSSETSTAPETGSNSTAPTSQVN